MIFCYIQAPFYSLLMLFMVFRLSNDKCCNTHNICHNISYWVYCGFYQCILPTFAGSAFFIMIPFQEQHSSLEASGRLPFSVLAAVYICSIRLLFLVILGFFKGCFFSLNYGLLVSRIILCFFFFAVCSSASVVASSPGTLVFISTLMFQLQCVEVYFVVYSNVLQYITMYFTVHLTALYIQISFLALDLPFISSLDIKLFVLICI